MKYFTYTAMIANLPNENGRVYTMDSLRDIINKTPFETNRRRILVEKAKYRSHSPSILVEDMVNENRLDLEVDLKKVCGTVADVYLDGPELKVTIGFDPGYPRFRVLEPFIEHLSLHAKGTGSISVNNRVENYWFSNFYVTP
jgi:hypothetical protein